ncbi:MAG: TlpA disulfide reductase family protein [Verrucomicrobiota bacterium]
MRAAFFTLLGIAAPLLLGTPTALAALKVGDAAPKLQTGSWLQGTAVTDFEGDKVYIVEFWATWCGPCKASIPHVNALHERFADKGLVVIGQDVMEKDDSLVAPFVQAMADKMTYRVATDDKSDGGRGRMAQNWLAAAEQNGIPCAFIINKQGRIVSIGHPMSIKEAELETLLAEPSTGGNAKGATRPNNAASVPSPKELELARRAQAEIRAGNLDKAETSLAALQDILTEKFRDIGAILNLELLLARKQTNDALQLTKILCEDFKGNLSVQNEIAAQLANQPDANATVLAAAEKIATPIAATPGDSQATALSTLMHIAFLRGDKPRAEELHAKVRALPPVKSAWPRRLIDGEAPK